ncbi:MAG: hypothetical protein ABWX90_03570 [Candidatus Saccharimonadales bacterium]
MNNFENQKDIEKETHLGLKGALESFEGTALIPLIKASLEEADIKPYAYDLEESGHAEYLGFPATSARRNSSGESSLSPIVSAIKVALEQGEIDLELASKNVRLKPWSMYPEDGSDPYAGNAHRTSKLNSVGLLALKDAESGEVLAFAARLASDGGRGGHAFISTNDVIDADTPR